MKDPTRLRDQAGVDSDVRELLSADAVPKMSEEERRRIGTHVAGVAAGTIATSLLLSAKSVAAALLVSASVLAVATMDSGADSPPEQPPHSAQAHAEPARRSPSPARAPIHEAASSPRIEAAVEPAIEPASAELPIEGASDRSEGDPRARRRPLMEVERVNATSPVVVTPVESDTLAREAALLEEARRQLERDPGGALAELERHQRLYPNAQLSEERELIAVDALLRLGRAGDASRRARALAAASPQSIHARRALRMVGEAAEE